MKTFIQVLLLLAVTGSFHAQAASAGEFLTQDQKKTVLSRIDGTCADTWCEGDYNYRFSSIDCDAASKSCFLRFTMIEDNGARARLAKVKETDKFVAQISTAHPVTCTVKNLSKYSDLAELNSFELNESYYAALTDCISALEAELKK